MVRVGDAHIRRSARGNIGDHIIVNVVIVGIKPQVYRNIRIQFLKIRYGLAVNIRLGLIGVIFGPERDFIVPGSVDFLRDSESCLLPASMTASQEETAVQPAKQSKQSRL